MELVLVRTVVEERWRRGEGRRGGEERRGGGEGERGRRGEEEEEVPPGREKTVW